jgi:hypothetical protein
MNPKPNLPLGKSQTARKMVRKALIIIFGLGLMIVAFCAVVLLAITAQKTEKNIVLIPPVLDGKVSSFVFMSLVIDGRGESSLVIVPVAAELKLTPLSQVLQTDPQLARLQRAQASVQTGVLVDEVWTTTELPTTFTKQGFLDTWRQQLPTAFNSQWWQARLALSDSHLELKENQTVGDLVVANQVGRISPAARQCSVAIVNTTQVAGLASAISQYLEKIGLIVIRVTDNQTNSDQSHLVVADKQREVCQEAVKVLDYISPEHLVVVENQEAADTYRAALVLLVGQNMIPVQEPNQ